MNYLSGGGYVLPPDEVIDGGDGVRVLIGPENVAEELPEDRPLEKGELVLANYEHNFVIANGFTTRPYELRVYLFG